MHNYILINIQLIVDNTQDIIVNNQDQFGPRLYHFVCRNLTTWVSIEHWT
jgi:hypothetical protein